MKANCGKIDGLGYNSYYLNFAHDNIDMDHF
jgi:hypothetical protein